VVHRNNSLNNKIYVAQPTPRDHKSRPSLIPQSVLEERKQNPLLDEQITREIKNNPVKDIIELNGGGGTFYIPDREHFILENPDWKNDIYPEFMDGKNVFDYVDPDILAKRRY